MRRFATVVVLALSIVVAGRVPGAWACSCALMDEAEHRRWATVVFEGTARDVTNGSGGMSSWRFDVERVIKGAPAEQLTVRSSTDEAGCGMSFDLGARYRIYARQDGSVLATGLCAGNHALDEAPPRATPTASPSESHRRGAGGADDAGDARVPLAALATATLAAVVAGARGRR